MAHAVVSVVVTDLSNYLMDEEDFLLGVEEQVLHLHTELVKMKYFLENSKGKCDQVDKIREIALKVAKIVDTYIVNVTKERRSSNPVKFFCGFNKATMVNSVKQQIKQLKTITEVINKNRDSYHMVHTQQNDTNEDEESYGMIDSMQRSMMEEDVIGLVEPKTLVNQLVSDNPEIQQICANEDDELQMHEDISFVKEAETLKNQMIKEKSENQQNSVNEDEELQMHVLPQKHGMEGEEDDVGFVDEAETVENQLVNDESEIQQSDVNEDEDLQMQDLLQQRWMEVKEDDIVGFLEIHDLLQIHDTSEIQQDDFNEDEDSQIPDLRQEHRMEVVEDNVVGFIEEVETLENRLVKNKSEIQQNDVNKDEELQMHDLLQKPKMEVEEDNGISFVDETETSMNPVVKDKSKIQQNNINKDEELQMHDLLQKPKMEIEDADDAGLIDEAKTLADNSKIQQNNVNKDEKLQIHVKNDVVGFVEEAERLVNQLVNGKAEVISIFGEGGLGKTTLARKVYNNEKVKDHFGLCAWVSVSQTYKLRELLLEILKAVSPMTDEILEMKKEQLKHELSKQLSNSRFLVVLDDIWEEKHWDELKAFFPNDIKGSRVLVTTQCEDVALYASRRIDSLELQFLNDEQSWELFTRKVFGRARNCPEDLKSLEKLIQDRVEIFKDMVAKCGGLPLAIVVLGGILSSKDKNSPIWNTTQNLWDTVESVDWYEQKDTQCLEALKIFSLSYRHLPPYLQTCFLYFGLFPEDYSIPARQLIQLWISEGFIEHEDDTSSRKEDVAEIYLNHLIDRSLVQVEERRSDGGVKTCRMHHLIRGFCLHLSKKEKFLESHNSVNSEKTKPQRLSIHCSRRDYILGAKSSNTSSVRTLLCFNDDNRDLTKKHWESLFKSFELIRVLDLGEVKVVNLSPSIHKLILLKYLRVKTDWKLPPSICDLNHLQTLDLTTSRIDVLPEGIWRMQQLRHLYLNGPGRLPKNAGTKYLFNLQTLCYISIDSTDGVHIAENAPNLRKLGLYGYRCNSSDEQDFTFKLPNLQSLKFVHKCVFHVRIKLPATITSISIKRANLKPETMETFQNLPNLQKLKLEGASFPDDELVFEEDWFPALQLLKIENSSMVIWKLGKGALPNLKQVVISKCLDLGKLPEELWDMSTLQELQLLWMPDSFTKKIGEFKKKSEVKVVIYPSAP